MSYISFPRPSFDLLRVHDITANNIQQNKVTETSDQFASARSMRRLSLAKNTAAQKAPNAQIGKAFNKIKLQSRAFDRDILVKNIDSVNAQSNDVFQDNKQKAISRTLGVDPAINGLWQGAKSYQAGVAFNSINITR